MFKQVYFHHVRRVYDLHLLNFLKLWLPNGQFSTDAEQHLSLSDPKVIAEIQNASTDETHHAYDPAQRFMTRKHYRRVYSPRPDHMHSSPDPGAAVFQALVNKFGEDSVKHDVNYDAGGLRDFPVLLEDGTVTSALSVSDVLQQDMPLSFDSVYVIPEMVDHVREYLKISTERIIEEHSS